MNKLMITEHSFKANSWDSFPSLQTIKLPQSAEILDFRCTGCDVALFVQHEEYAEPEEREIRAYQLSTAFIPPDPSQYIRLGIAGEACNKCVIYISRSNIEAGRNT